MERIPYALAADGSTVHISEVRHAGLACRCTCPACGAALEAVNVENPAPQRAPHFRHYELEPTSDCALYAANAGLARLLDALTRITLPGEPQRSESDPPARGQMALLDFDEEGPRRGAVQRSQRIDASTVRLHLADGQVIELQLQQRAARGSPDWSVVSAVLDLPLSVQDLLSMPPAEALDLLRSARGRWLRRPPPRTAQSPPAAPPNRVQARQPPPPVAAPAAPHRPWQYLWSAQDPVQQDWQRAIDTMLIRHIPEHQVHRAIAALRRRRTPNAPALPALVDIARESGLSESIVRDIAQHARAIRVG